MHKRKDHQHNKDRQQHSTLYWRHQHATIPVSAPKYIHLDQMRPHKAKKEKMSPTTNQGQQQARYHDHITTCQKLWQNFTRMDTYIKYDKLTPTKFESYNMSLLDVECLSFEANLRAYCSSPPINVFMIISQPLCRYNVTTDNLKIFAVNIRLQVYILHIINTFVGISRATFIVLSWLSSTRPSGLPILPRDRPPRCGQADVS